MSHIENVVLCFQFKILSPRKGLNILCGLLPLEYFMNILFRFIDSTEGGGGNEPGPSLAS